MCSACNTFIHTSISIFLYLCSVNMPNIRFTYYNYSAIMIIAMTDIISSTFFFCLYFFIICWIYKFLKYLIVANWLYHCIFGIVMYHVTIVWNWQEWEIGVKRYNYNWNLFNRWSGTACKLTNTWTQGNLIKARQI